MDAPGNAKDKAAESAARARRWLLVGLGLLVVLVWFGPAGWLRGDPTEAERAEEAADAAETAARTPPALSAEDAQERLDTLEQLQLTEWSDQASFWATYLPELPEGLRLAALAAGDPDPTPVESVHTRTLSLELALPPAPPAPEGEPQRLPDPAPGGWVGTWDWMAGLNQRPDMRLQSIVVSTNGSAEATFRVWLKEPEGTTENPSGAVEGSAEES